MDRSASCWADEVEEEEAELESAGIALPTPKQLIEEELEQQRAQEVYYAEPTGPALPDRPPYKVYISNIPYQIDEMVVERHFHGLKILDVHITTHRDTGKPKACFVEFASQDMMRQALGMGGVPMLNRRVDIQPAEPKSSDRRGGGFGGRDGFFGDREPRRQRSGYMEERAPSFARQRSGYDDRDRPYHGPPEDYRSGREPARYDSFLEDRDRRGYDRGFGGGSFRQQGGEFGDGFHSQGSRGDLRRNYSGASRGSDHWPAGGGGGGGGHGDDRSPRWSALRDGPSGSQSHSPRERPKLHLVPRGSSGLDAAAAGAAAPADAASPTQQQHKARPDPFGGAKPVDTQAKLRELEEKERQRRVEEVAQKKAEREEAAHPPPPPPHAPPHTDAPAAEKAQEHAPVQQAPPPTAAKGPLALPSPAAAPAAASDPQQQAQQRPQQQPQHEQGGKPAAAPSAPPAAPVQAPKPVPSGPKPVTVPVAGLAAPSVGPAPGLHLPHTAEAANGGGPSANGVVDAGAGRGRGRGRGEGRGGRGEGRGEGRGGRGEGRGGGRGGRGHGEGPHAEGGRGSRPPVEGGAGRGRGPHPEGSERPARDTSRGRASRDSSRGRAPSSQRQQQQQKEHPPQQQQAQQAPPRQRPAPRPPAPHADGAAPRQKEEGPRGHREGESDRGGRGGRGAARGGGGGRGERERGGRSGAAGGRGGHAGEKKQEHHEAQPKPAAKPAAPAPPKSSKHEIPKDDTPKTKIDNPFDLLRMMGNE